MLSNHFQQPSPRPVNAFCEIRFSKIHGRGVFTSRNLRLGSKIIEYRGELIDKEESNRRGNELFETSQHTGGASVYIFDLDETHDLDGDKEWNPARLINHTCEPNAEMIDEDGRLYLYALSDIRKGEEISFDYGYDIEHFLDHTCRCGKPSCVGYIVSQAQWLKLAKRLKNKKRAKLPASKFDTAH